MLNSCLESDPVRILSPGSIPTLLNQPWGTSSAYLTETEPWKLFKTDPERVQTILNLSLQICANLAILCEPFLPFTAEKINRMLQLEKRPWKCVWTW